MSGGWKGSNRRATLPPDWDTVIRPRILARDGHACVWIDDGIRCGRHGSEVDHIGDKNDHRDENLRTLCRWHHYRRSSQQGNNSPNRVRVSEKRPREAHPGYVR